MRFDFSSRPWVAMAGLVRFLLGAWVLAMSPGIGGPVGIELLVEPGGLSETWWLTDQGEALSSVEFSGVIQAQIEVDRESLEPVHIWFTGGGLLYSDGTSVYQPYQLPATEDLAFTTTGMGATLFSVAESPVVGAGGLLDPADHGQVIDRGTLLTEYRQRFLGQWVTLFSDLHDYGQEPATSALSGTTRVFVESSAQGPLCERMEVRMVHESDTTPMTYPVGTGSLTVVGSGGFTAVAEVMVPSAGLRTWLALGGVEYDLTDMPAEAVFYAMGLPPGSRVLPVEFADGGERVLLEFPETGTRAPLGIEVSGDLMEWEALDWPGGGKWLPAGSVGMLEVPLAAGAGGFVRLRVLGCGGE